MAVAVSKKSGMTLFSGSNTLDSHRVRMVLAEKGLQSDIIEVDRQESPEDLLEVNPYNTVPTLVDRNLVVYHARIIMEYLDERFPHPPLLPVYPVSRAQFRLMMHRIEKDWYSLVEVIQSGTPKAAEKARAELTESLIGMAPLFSQTPFLMSDEFSMIDCTVAPLLWRLPEYGIELPKTAKAIHAYCERIFERKGFRESLTDTEIELRLGSE
ncbi:MAG: stringent starvation protein A [Gammaproteobacteria bacterium CG11_big_fil_rev_8_21_14_0_20_46_22]|nr:MAG: stringent starvation protein A [Gammaproteobacteria bacterium CG12_big_fil_rev_8_21_14_0_65_46_12]PIR11114.1 MAG: stringent starvation protein A [Gammaproteobacteria bacterium CG11_big_fil_rev_8_21_14_0_20_46_22]